jgi:organic hydroperoxide reductase OsmC/OhrA
MAGRQHTYRTTLEWTGNRGTGTSDYRAYGRDHTISCGSKPAIAGSSDPLFRGDPARWNPEELLVTALSACHQLSYLHLCAVNGVAVTAYRDEAEGVMAETPEGGGRFTRVVLRPQVVIRPGDDLGLAERLHHDAHRLCFIASSVNFPVACEPTVSAGSDLGR